MWQNLIHLNKMIASLDCNEGEISNKIYITIFIEVDSGILGEIVSPCCAPIWKYINLSTKPEIFSFKNPYCNRCDRIVITPKATVGEFVRQSHLHFIIDACSQDRTSF